MCVVCVGRMCACVVHVCVSVQCGSGDGGVCVCAVLV